MKEPFMNTTETAKLAAAIANGEVDLTELVEVSADRKTVWVHAMDGSTVGRFSKSFGMDVHTTTAQQLSGASQCLNCTHTKPQRADWEKFCELIEAHYGIPVDLNLIEI